MRDITLDIAKGIGIILVIVVHYIQSESLYGRIFVYAFHMPLFFFISGVCLHTHYSPQHRHVWKRYWLVNRYAKWTIGKNV